MGRLDQPEIQERARREILDFLERHEGRITYENVNELTYLQRCMQGWETRILGESPVKQSYSDYLYHLSETFRMYPSLPFIDRECTPDSGRDSYSLSPDLDYDMPRGFPVYIPTFALHRDEKYFPNPNVYDPDRFAESRVKSIPQCAYIPFGLGPRNCIGER